MTSYLVPDRSVDRVRDLGLDSFVRRAHSHRERLIIECTEPLVTGELLLDPGIEDQVANFFGETTVPEYSTVTKEWEWIGGRTLPYPGLVPWSANSRDNWEIDTTDPRNGTYHLQSVQSPIGNSPQAVELNRRFPCDNDTLVNSGRVTEGQLVTWQAYVKPSIVGSGSVTMRIQFLAEGGGTGPGLFTTNVANISTAYELYSLIVVAPANSYWMRAEIRPLNGGSGITWRTDDASLVVA